MQNNLVNRIISILDTDSSWDEKRSALRQERGRRRGRNRIVLSFIIDLLYEYILPLNFEDVFSLPTIKELTAKEYDTLLRIAQGSSCHYFKAVWLDLAWEHYHNIDLANEAMITYFNVLKSETDDYRQTAVVTAICRIYSIIQSNEFNIYELHSFCIETLIPSLPSNDRSICTIIRSLLMSSYTHDLEKYILNLIAIKEANKEFLLAIDLTEILIDLYKKEKRSNEKQTLLCNLARYHEETANLLDWDNPQNARRIIYLIQKSMSFWAATQLKASAEERKRLAKRIEPIKKLSLKTIKTVTGGPFDLTETINQMRSLTQKASFEECITNFIFAVSLITPDKLKVRHTKNGFLSSLFATTALDSDGRIKCIVPSLHGANSNDELCRWEHEAESEYTLYADALISRYLHIIRERFSFTQENLQFIVDNNAFIPENRKKSFLIGLTAGFNFDYITALSILMPQVENAIRCLASECGAVVYKTKDNGVEECLSLDSILKLPEVEACLDPVFLFNLKVFYTSDYGFGMRNTVGHGLISDDEFSSFHGLIVWWFTLRICCTYSFELRKRIFEYSASNKAT